MRSVRPCIAIPIYDHGETITHVVESLENNGLPCIIVDDGCHSPAREVLDALEDRFSWVRVVHHPVNRGRGAALRTAYRTAHESGLTHVIQLDADGQHDPKDVPSFMAAARSSPDALILGTPIFDDSIPLHRLHGRKLSKYIVWLQTMSRSVIDPLCGFRCIPVEAAMAVIRRTTTGNRMDFDPELIIRLVRAGVPVVNVPTRVRYPEGGISHFRMLEDNARIAWCYLRLCVDFRGWRTARSTAGSRSI